MAVVSTHKLKNQTDRRHKQASKTQATAANKQANGQSTKTLVMCLRFIQSLLLPFPCWCQ